MKHGELVNPPKWTQHDTATVVTPTSFARSPWRENIRRPRRGGRSRESPPRWRDQVNGCQIFASLRIHSPLNPSWNWVLSWVSSWYLVITSRLARWQAWLVYRIQVCLQKSIGYWTMTLRNRYILACVRDQRSPSLLHVQSQQSNAKKSNR